MKTASYAQSFSRAAKEYDAYAYLQQTVARELASWIEGMECESILDLGCGTGALWRALRFKPRFFTGVDLSMEMLDLHPQDPAIRLIQSDFNHPSLYERSYDLIAASSSLQWSRDLAQSFDLIAKSAQNVAFAIFTSESLWEIHDYVNSHSPIPSKEQIESLLKERFAGEFELKRYPLSFPSRVAMLSYLKGSGISGGRRLGFAQSKKLIQSAPFERLTFEVLFFVGKPLKADQK